MTHRQCIVIGSGPGGSVTANALAEAGFDVLILEEGESLSQNATTPFSKEEMIRKYRNRGITVALGSPKLSYVEGCVVGGGSEINAGLYHRTPVETLAKWKKDFDLAESSERELLPYFEFCEHALNVSFYEGQIPKTSLKLKEGAEKLGWKVLEVPRWYQRNERRSMSATFIPMALQHGAELKPRTCVRKIRQEHGGKWRVSGFSGIQTVDYTCDYLFVCAGAIHTPFLLQKSGVKNNIGRSLAMHPTLKLICQFAETINDENSGVAVHQVKEFSPSLSMGCSISSPPYLALGLLDYPQALSDLQNQWKKMACYHVMVSGVSRGQVLALPSFHQPIVKYKMNQEDRAMLEDGLKKLTELAFAADAEQVFPSLRPMMIHLFASCPMGENKEKTAVNSFGRVHGFKNLYIADGSILCGSPSVNPQGSIMAFALRNAKKFVEEKNR